MGYFISFVEIFAVAGALAGIAYNVFCLWAARSFLEAGRDSHNFAPPVSILKPLRGADPDMYAAFRSHCLQDYPEYEIIFGVNDRRDPAARAVERLMREFPERQIRLVVCAQALGANMKVSSLVQMLVVARYDYLIVNDSDIRVPPDYLRRVLGAFDPEAGMVTCLYRGRAGNTLGSKLEALGISTDFAPGVLAARVLQGVRFGLGSTLAMSRRALQAAGGFESVVEYLADDYELGARIAHAGFKVRLGRVIVDHLVPDYSFRDFWRHQLRWARGVRDSRPGGYLGLGFTLAVPWAIAALAGLRGAALGWALLLTAFAARFAVTAVVGGRVLRDSQLRKLWWLLPLRDMVALLVWIASFAGHTVTWRGDKFLLHKGRITPVTQGVPSVDVES